MITPNEIFGAVNIIAAIACAIVVAHWAIIFHKHRHHSLLVKRQSNLTIFTCVVSVLVEIFLIIPFTLHYTNFSFFSKSVQLIAGLIVFLGAPFVMYGIFGVYVLRYVISLYVSFN